MDIIASVIDNCKIMSAFRSFPSLCFGISGNPVLISGFRVKHGMTSRTAHRTFYYSNQ